MLVEGSGTHHGVGRWRRREPPAVESGRGILGARHIRFCGRCGHAAVRCLRAPVLPMCVVKKCEHRVRWSLFGERDVVAG
jgi:hypothetical protein